MFNQTCPTLQSRLLCCAYTTYELRKFKRFFSASLVALSMLSVNNDRKYRHTCFWPRTSCLCLTGALSVVCSALATHRDRVAVPNPATVFTIPKHARSCCVAFSDRYCIRAVLALPRSGATRCCFVFEIRLCVTFETAIIVFELAFSLARAQLGRRRSLNGY